VKLWNEIVNHTQHISHGNRITFEGKQQKFFRIEKTASPYLVDTQGSGFLI